MQSFRFSSLRNVLRDPLAILRNTQAIVAALGGIFAILLTVGVGLSSEDTQDPGREVGSSGDYVVPPLEEQEKLDGIRKDLNYAVKQLRAEEFDQEGIVSPPVFLDLTLQIQAERWAQSNAVEGQESAIDRNVSMLQVNLPAEEATAEAIMGRILGSQPHTDILLDPEMAFYGIGVARSDDRVWAVLMFSAAGADLDEPTPSGGSSADA